MEQSPSLPREYDVVVADTVNHLLRGIRLATGETVTTAGTGRQWRSTVDDHAHDARSMDLSSPWDVAWYQGKLIVAMAGTHTLWWFDPVKRAVGHYARTTARCLADAAFGSATEQETSLITFKVGVMKTFLAAATLLAA